MPCIAHSAVHYLHKHLVVQDKCCKKKGLVKKTTRLAMCIVSYLFHLFLLTPFVLPMLHQNNQARKIPGLIILQKKLLLNFSKQCIKLFFTETVQVRNQRSALNYFVHYNGSQLCYVGAAQ